MNVPKDDRSDCAPAPGSGISRAGELDAVVALRVASPGGSGIYAYLIERMSAALDTGMRVFVAARGGYEKYTESVAGNYLDTITAPAPWGDTELLRYVSLERRHHILTDISRVLIVPPPIPKTLIVIDDAWYLAMLIGTEPLKIFAEECLRAGHQVIAASIRAEETMWLMDDNLKQPAPVITLDQRQRHFDDLFCESRNRSVGGD